MNLCRLEWFFPLLLSLQVQNAANAQKTQAEDEHDVHGPGAGGGWWHGDMWLQRRPHCWREPERCSHKCLSSLRMQISQEAFSFWNTKTPLKIWESLGVTQLLANKPTHTYEKYSVIYSSATERCCAHSDNDGDKAPELNRESFLMGLHSSATWGRR